MKKLIVPVVCATLAIASAQSFAFGGKKDGDRGGFDMVHKMDHMLDLTVAQKAQIREIQKKYRIDRKDSRKARKALMKLDPSARNYDAKLAELAEVVADQAKQKVISHGKMRAEIQSVLTPAQSAILAQHKQDRAERAESRH